MSPSRFFRAGALGLAASLAGCASYHPLALPTRPNLAPGLAQLDLTLPPPEPGKAAVKLNPQGPLTPDEVGVAAILNNPDLKALPGKLDAAQADLLAATILPNPSLGFGYAFLVSGPGTADAITASISQDVRSIVTYSTRVHAAKARVRQVSADSLWQEWQVAQKARLLAVDINADEREIKLREQELDLLNRELKEIRAATAAGNLDLSAEAPLIAAATGAERDLATARLTRLKDWQDLDALLGLQPTARFAISAPEPVKLPENIDPLIESLPARRPDFVAFRLGYSAAESDVRAAILGQFPAFSLGGAGGSDTSEVVSVGPQITMDLPIFDRNQAKIAATRASRQQLHTEYQVRLDEAEGTARSLLARSRVLEANLERARKASETASSLLNTALHAYQQGNISQRDLTDFQTTALDRQLDALGYERTLEESSLALSIELGLGFPQTMIAPHDQVTRS